MHATSRADRMNQVERPISNIYVENIKKKETIFLFTREMEMTAHHNHNVFQFWELDIENALYETYRFTL